MAAEQRDSLAQSAASGSEGSHCQSAIPERCHQCDTPMDSPIGCLECHVIFPTRSGLTHFDRLGLTTTFAIDREELERKFLLWSRELHPDFFALASPESQRLSQSLMASLNDAYVTLKDPFRRAEYLLQLRGGPSASQEKQMPPGFLEEVLELRMEIAELNEEGATPATSPQAAKLEEQIRSDRKATLQRVGSLFSQPEGATPEGLIAIRRELNTIKYLDGLLRDLHLTN